MPTPTDPAARTQRVQRLLLGGTVAFVLALAGTYAAGGDWSTAAGVLTGAGLVLLLLVLATRRARRKGVEAGTAERVFGGRPDERDAHVYVGTLAAVGVVALVVAALAPVAVGFGLDAVTMVKALPYLLIGTGVVAFVVIDRRT